MFVHTVVLRRRETPQDNATHRTASGVKERNLSLFVVARTDVLRKTTMTTTMNCMACRQAAVNLDCVWIITLRTSVITTSVTAVDYHFYTVASWHRGRRNPLQTPCPAWELRKRSQAYENLLDLEVWTPDQGTNVVGLPSLCLVNCSWKIHSMWKSCSFFYHFYMVY